jgi:hypothetical protein
VTSENEKTMELDRRKKSWVWKYFTVVSGEGGKLALCNYRGCK